MMSSYDDQQIASMTEKCIGLDQTARILTADSNRLRAINAELIEIIEEFMTSPPGLVSVWQRARTVLSRAKCGDDRSKEAA